MNRRRTRNTIVVLGAAILVLAGCAGSTEPSRFYVLSTPLDLTSEKPAAGTSPSMSLGVGPVTLPLHLDRPQIVTHATHHKLELAEFDRWAEPLKDNFTRVLAENLSILIGTDRIAVFPWRRSIPIDYQVTVEVIRFDGVFGGDMSLAARWMIFGKDGRKLLFTRKSQFSAAAGGADFESAVEALSRTLVDLSREIATALQAL